MDGLDLDATQRKKAGFGHRYLFPIELKCKRPWASTPDHKETVINEHTEALREGLALG